MDKFWWARYSALKFFSHYSWENTHTESGSASIMANYDINILWYILEEIHEREFRDNTSIPSLA